MPATIALLFFLCAGLLICGALEIRSIVEGPPQFFEQKAVSLSIAAVAIAAGLFTSSLHDEGRGGAALRITSVILAIAGLLSATHYTSLVWNILH